jgi:hypothetical protein
VDKIIKHQNIINFIRAQSLGWLGHVEWMQETRMVKTIHSWKPISRRPIGRPKLRWEDDVRKDIQKLKLTNWNWLRKPKLCIKCCRAIIRRRHGIRYTSVHILTVLLLFHCNRHLEVVVTTKLNCLHLLSLGGRFAMFRRV